MSSSIHSHIEIPRKPVPIWGWAMGGRGEGMKGRAVGRRGREKGFKKTKYITYIKYITSLQKVFQLKFTLNIFHEFANSLNHFIFVQNFINLSNILDNFRYFVQFHSTSPIG